MFSGWRRLFPNLAPISAPISSKRGKVIFFNGATFDLDATKLVTTSPSLFCPCSWETTLYAFSLASQKMRSLITCEFCWVWIWYHLGMATRWSCGISAPHWSHFLAKSGGNCSSQPNPRSHSSWNRHFTRMVNGGSRWGWRCEMMSVVHFSLCFLCPLKCLAVPLDQTQICLSLISILTQHFQYISTGVCFCCVLHSTFHLALSSGEFVTHLHRFMPAWDRISFAVVVTERASSTLHELEIKSST